MFNQVMLCLTNHAKVDNQNIYMRYKSRKENSPKNQKITALVKLKNKSTKVCTKDESKWTVYYLKSLLTQKKHKWDPPASEIKDNSTLMLSRKKQHHHISPITSPVGLDNDENDLNLKRFNFDIYYNGSE